MVQVVRFEGTAVLQVAPPSAVQAVTIPLAPPVKPRSCCHAAI